MRDGSTMLPAIAIDAIDVDDDGVEPAAVGIAPGIWGVCCLVCEPGPNAQQTTRDEGLTL